MNNLRESGYPLSALQTKLWLRQASCRQPGRFHSAALFQIQGELQSSSIVQALGRMLASQAIFRTVFRRLPGLRTAFQAQDDRARPSVVFADLASLEPALRAVAASAAAEQIRKKPFVLEEGPLVRASILRLSSREHQMLLCCHPLVGDLQSLASIGCGLVSQLGRTSLSGEEGIPFQQFALQHNAMLAEGEFEQENAFWQALGNGDALSSGPLWFSAAQPMGGWCKCKLPVGADTAQRLRDLSGRLEGSLADIVFVALCVVLPQLFAQRRLTVSRLSDTRSFFEIGETLGPLTELLDFGCEFDGRQPFWQLLRKGIADYLVLTENQAFVPPGESSGSPFAFADLTMAPTASSLVREAWLHWPGISFLAALSGSQEAPSLQLQFDSSRVPLRHAKAFLSRWKHSLSQFSTHPKTHSGKNPILLAAEREYWLSEFNRPLRDPSQETTPQRIAAWAVRAPDRIASQCGSSLISFAALLGQAGRIASGLKASGICPADVVALRMGPGFEMLASILATWLARAAYLPLDPQDPPRRTSFLIEDSRARLALVECGGQLSGIRAMPVELSGHSQAPFEAGRWTDRADPQEVAYLLYTSGSTGTPKGVEIVHSALSNYLDWANSSLFGNHVQALPVLTKLVFDACLKQLFAPLLRGQAVWFIPPATARDPRALSGELLLRTHVGVNCVPALWAALVAELEDASDDARQSIRGVYLGGEVLPEKLVARTHRLLPQAEFRNLYGPTEATANASWALLSPDRPLTIGRPIANARVYVLDSSGHLCPLGTPGELFIGGLGLAAAYLRRPALTAQRFVPDPFSQLPGARLFRSGDRAALNQQGDLVFLGRLDGQVKIRGYRVELGEIEAAIAAFGGIAECAVSLVGESGPATTLAAFLVQEGQADHEGLGQHLSRLLPAYMIPDAFFDLPALPRLPNHKIDRVGLSNPSFAATLQAKPYVAPASPEEAQIAAIWQRVLGIDRVSVDADIFSVGGHSLAAARIVNQITDELGVGISLEAFLTSATISGVAALVCAARQGKDRVVQQEAMTATRSSTGPEGVS